MRPSTAIANMVVVVGGVAFSQLQHPPRLQDKRPGPAAGPRAAANIVRALMMQ